MGKIILFYDIHASNQVSMIVCALSDVLLMLDRGVPKEELLPLESYFLREIELGKDLCERTLAVVEKYKKAEVLAEAPEIERRKGVIPLLPREKETVKLYSGLLKLFGKEFMHKFNEMYDLFQMYLLKRLRFQKFDVWEKGSEEKILQCAEKAGTLLVISGLIHGAEYFEKLRKTKHEIKVEYPSGRSLIESMTRQENELLREILRLSKIYNISGKEMASISLLRQVACDKTGE